MRNKLTLVLCAVAFGGLTACGDSIPEQALIGAGAGAGTALVLDGSVAGGAILGAAGNVAYCQAYPGQCN